MVRRDFLTENTSPLILVVVDDRTVQPADDMRGYGGNGGARVADFAQSCAEVVGHAVGQGGSEEMPVGIEELAKIERTSEEIDRLEKEVQKIWKMLASKRRVRTQGVKGIVKTILDYESSLEDKELAQRPIQADPSIMEEVLSKHNEPDHELIKRFITEGEEVPILNRKYLAIEAPSYIYGHKGRVELRERIIKGLGVDVSDKDSPEYQEAYQNIQSRRFTTEQLLRMLIIQMGVSVDEVDLLAEGIPSDISPEKVQETLTLFLRLTDKQILEGDVPEDSSPRPRTIRKSVSMLLKYYYKKRRKKIQQ